eukprot:756511-Hanusia_phi.AAC.3
MMLRSSFFLLSLSLLPSLSCSSIPSVPQGIAFQLDPAYSRAVVARWTNVDGILSWKVHRNCSFSQETEIFQVVEPEFVDNQRENSSCSYRIEACNQEGCGPLSDLFTAVFSTRPDPPPILTVSPSSSSVLTVNYAAPLNKGGGDWVDVDLTNYEVQLSQSADFSIVAAVSFSESLTQHVHCVKGVSYYIRARAANAIGWSGFSVFAQEPSKSPAPVRCISVPSSPSSIASILPVDVETLQVAWDPPLDTGAWDTSVS